MDSAESTACEENEAKVAAILLGDVGEEKAPAPAVSSSLRFFIASACRLGGPRRLLGRSKVQGMSRTAQARHGGPDSSHCTRGRRQQTLPML